MKQRKQLWTGIFAAIGMLILILDAKTAVAGAGEGVQLCIRSVIPSLFPFLILSNLISNALVGKRTSLLAPLGKLCAIPTGGESLLLLGLAGGYPVGAKVIASAYKSGSLSKRSAERMLGYCNNAGPAFIFGLVRTLFSSAAIPWVIWIIHILSALVVGMILPDKHNDTCSVSGAKPIGITTALEKSVVVIANICGWVIVFRMITSVCSRWFSWLLPPMLQPLFAGLLELTNGITVLQSIPTEGARFVFSTCLLSVGGVCVGMQTRAITEALDMSAYFPGKVLQGIISLFMAAIMQVFLFDHSEILQIHGLVYIALLSVAFLTFWLLRYKKSSDKPVAVVV